MRKRVFLVHGWEGTPEKDWLPWLKKELGKRNFEVFVPAMPQTYFPVFEKWLATLQKVVGRVEKNDYFVGHSLGCITILRFLEKVKRGKKVGGVVLVAGFTDDLGIGQIKSFFKDKINFAKIKKSCPRFVAIHSDNDYYVDLKYANIFKEKLGAKLIIEHDKKHFTGEDGFFNLPLVLKACLEIAKSH